MSLPGEACETGGLCRCMQQAAYATVAGTATRVTSCFAATPCAWVVAPSSSRWQAACHTSSGQLAVRQQPSAHAACTPQQASPTSVGAHTAEERDVRLSAGGSWRPADTPESAPRASPKPPVRAKLALRKTYNARPVAHVPVDQWGCAVRLGAGFVWPASPCGTVHLPGPR